MKCLHCDSDAVTSLESAASCLWLPTNCKTRHQRLRTGAVEGRNLHRGNGRFLHVERWKQLIAQGRSIAGRGRDAALLGCRKDGVSRSHRDVWRLGPLG
jgi:hypothetical protein